MCLNLHPMQSFASMKFSLLSPLTCELSFEACSPGQGTDRGGQSTAAAESTPYGGKFGIAWNSDRLWLLIWPRDVEKKS